jgi:prolyl oligopeptidase
MTRPRFTHTPHSAPRRHLLARAAAVATVATLASTQPLRALAAAHAVKAPGVPAALPPLPVARVQAVRETFFGQVVVDPYRWMENPKDSEWEPFMRGQDAHARAVLSGIPGRDALKARIAELSGGTALAFNAQRAGDKLF